ncbi:2OG-Fe(II) oxygenase [Sphingomonas sp. HDW15A]|uniref:2OG-Fe(II) oxygenase n=1 Tax=Sphingomonas sp. HDW15A TaxID=2714942 RepID=UPI001408D3F0|nr:2OG-Fe(II) oxygenase [Sphingomonas sp. HDW15A]QIK96620.1 2OG-Fe(II) oxygenase [Sphingomonas sp. HDW15A]
MLDLARIRAAEVQEKPYPFFTVEQAILADSVDRVASDFPKIGRAGVVNPSDTSPGPAFAALLDELKGDAFRSVIAEKFDVTLDGLDIKINLRGHARKTDGNIHTDTPTKAVTVLLYFNKEQEAASSETGLRILKNSSDLDDYVAEVPPLLGNMLAFKVTPNCWHGHKPFEGERRSLQLNYLSGLERTKKHERVRRFFRHVGRRIGLD